MDLQAIINALRSDLEKLDRAIAAFEQLQGGLVDLIPKSPRRGRKSMGQVERKAVSQRMKRYWAKRRKEKE